MAKKGRPTSYIPEIADAIAMPLGPFTITVPLVLEVVVRVRESPIEAARAAPQPALRLMDLIVRRCI